MLISGYIGEFEYVDDHRAGKIVVELNGRLNKCGVISPRFDVGVKEIESWTARLLPSRQVSSGILFCKCHYIRIFLMMILMGIISALLFPALYVVQSLDEYLFLFGLRVLKVFSVFCFYVLSCSYSHIC